MISAERRVIRALGKAGFSGMKRSDLLKELTYDHYALTITCRGLRARGAVVVFGDPDLDPEQAVWKLSDEGKKLYLMLGGGS